MKKYKIADTIFKDMKREVPVQLSILINLFSTGIFPGSLKLVRVIPIFKKKDQQDSNNYRQISVLSNIDKLIEKHLYNRLKNFWIKTNISIIINLACEIIILLILHWLAWQKKYEMHEMMIIMPVA